MSQVTNTIPHFRNSGNVKMQYAQRENLAFQTNRAHLQYRRSSPEAPELSSSTGQHALKTTIGKMKTEGRPTRAPILTVVDRPIRIGFQMEKKIFDKQIRPKSAPGAGKTKAGRSDRTDRWRFRALPGTGASQGRRPHARIADSGAPHGSRQDRPLRRHCVHLQNHSLSNSGRLELQLGGYRSCA